MATQNVLPRLEKKIVDGPNKYDLSVSMFSRGVTVYFTIEGEKQPRETVVLGVNAEDESRESWNLSIRFTGVPRRIFSVYYSTQRRRGVITWPQEETEDVKRLPQNGDRAYTLLQGSHIEGTLETVRVGGVGHHGMVAQLRPHDKGKQCPWHHSPTIGVGYDVLITWDKEAKMWYAPADSD